MPLRWLMPRKPRPRKGPLQVRTADYDAKLTAARASVCKFIDKSDFAAVGKSRRTWEDIGCKFIQNAYETRVSLGDATLGILCIMRFLACARVGLRRSWEMLHAWKLAEPGEYRVPCPKNLMQSMTAICFASGAAAHGLDAAIWFSMAVLIWLSFDALLRPVEAFRLQRRHIIFSTDVGAAVLEWTVVVVTAPKNRRFMGHSQFVLLESMPLVVLLHWYCADLPAGSYLFPACRSKFSAYWKNVLTLLGISGLRLHPSSLRPGGATEYFRSSGGNVQALLFRGRWCSLRSLNHYLQEAISVVVGAKVPLTAKPGLAAAEAAFRLLEEAPCQSLRCILGPKVFALAFGPLAARKLSTKDKSRAATFQADDGNSSSSSL